MAIDLAGHGESGAGRQAWSMSAFGDDVAAVVERVDEARTVLIGHSMGGDVVVEAALKLRERVAGLVWIDVYSTLGEPRAREELEALIAPFRKDFVTATRHFVRGMFVAGSDPGLVDWVATDMSAAPSDIALDALENAIGNEGAVVAGLRELTAPVVAINPDHRPTDVEALRRHGIETVLMPDVGHFLMMEDPDQFNGVLTDVVANLTPNTAPP